MSADGLTATDGVHTLTVGQAFDLDPAGQTVAVAGSGYDEEKGIYVALCAIPPANHVPSPCGGGIDTAGQAGAAQWISSNPPDYGVGLAQPYGPGGSFSTSFAVSPVLGAGLDCRTIRCALVTRADHTRTADRSQDILIPVSFRVDTGPATTAPPVVPGPGGDTQSTAVPSTVTVPPVASSTTTAAPRTTVVSADQRSVTDGTRTLAVSATEVAAGATVVVNGSGYDESLGVYVAVCAAPAEGSRPGPCASGSTEVSAWVSSSPPEFGVDLALPYEAGGFQVEIEVPAVIDADTDCRVVACAVVTRNDDTNPDDPSQDLAVPITVDVAPAETGGSSAEPDAAASAAPTDIAVDDEGGGSSAWPIAAGVGVLVAAGAGCGLALRRRGTSVAATEEPGMGKSA